MITKLLEPIRAIRTYMQLPEAAKTERRHDLRGLPSADPGIDVAIDEGIRWLSRAQDCSTSNDGGVARHFSLLTGWSSSYPETTGYIVCTLLAYANLRHDDESRKRARRMLDWLVSIQFQDGGFQGGVVGSTPVVPVIFNTGQILLGLASGVREFGDVYRKAMCRTADWLVASQDSDGCWRKPLKPFVKVGEKAYETHVAWGLFEAAAIQADKSYQDAAISNIRWTLTLQHENGWFDRCCISDDTQPLTHTLGYTLRGIIEAYRFTKEEVFLAAARKTANGLLTAVRSDGFLPGRLFSDWRTAAHWACLTGSVQIAHCWLMLYQDTGDIRYRDAAYVVNRYVRCTMKVEGPLETRGAIKGSFPVQGGYGTYEYLNWACKFFIDSNMLEKTLREEGT